MDAGSDREVLRAIASMQRYHATNDMHLNALRVAMRAQDKRIKEIIELLQLHSNVLIKLEGSSTLAEAAAGPAMSVDERRVADTIPQQVNS